MNRRHPAKMTPEMKVLFDMAIAHIGALIMSKHLTKDDRLLLLVLAECVKERMTGQRGSLSPIVDAVETALAKLTAGKASINTMASDLPFMTAKGVVYKFAPQNWRWN